MTRPRTSLARFRRTAAEGTAADGTTTAGDDGRIDLVDRGHSDDSTPGAGVVELHGIMCDGTLVLGCTELDGSTPDDADFDAQNGHVHDVADADTTHFVERWPEQPFFPEIAYYETTSCPAPGGP